MSLLSDTASRQWIAMGLQDEWASLCNEHDSVWREYIRASRAIRSKVEAKLKGVETSPSLGELAREHRAWHRVREVREKMDAFLKRYLEISEMRPGRRAIK